MRDGTNSKGYARAARCAPLGVRIARGLVRVRGNCLAGLRGRVMRQVYLRVCMSGLEMTGLKGCEGLVGQRLNFWLALGDHSICRSWKAIDWLNTVDLNSSSQGTERQRKRPHTSRATRRGPRTFGPAYLAADTASGRDQSV
jgi:hypothetical protein